MVYPITEMVTTCLEVLRRICDDAIATVVLHMPASADDGGDSVAAHEDAGDEWADKYVGMQALSRRAIARCSQVLVNTCCRFCSVSDAGHLLKALFKLFDYQNLSLAAAHVLAEATPLEAAEYIGAHGLLPAVLATALDTAESLLISSECDAGRPMWPLAHLLRLSDRSPALTHDLLRCVQELPWLGSGPAVDGAPTGADSDPETSASRRLLALLATSPALAEDVRVSVCRQLATATATAPVVWCERLAACLREGGGVEPAARYLLEAAIVRGEDAPPTLVSATLAALDARNQPGATVADSGRRWGTAPWPGEVDWLARQRAPRP